MEQPNRNLKPSQCNSCTLCNIGKSFVHINTEATITPSTTPHLLIVTDYPIQSTLSTGQHLPQNTLAGATFHRAARLGELNLANVTFTTALKCIIPFELKGKKNLSATPEYYCGSQYLSEEIARLRPTAILAAGPLATRVLTGFFGGKQKLDYIRGYVIPCIYDQSIPVIPTFCPKDIGEARTEYFRVFARDIHFAYSISQGLTPATESPTNYSVSSEVPEEYFSASNPVIGFDLETREASKVDEEERITSNLPVEITSIQLSHSPGQATFIPWSPTVADQMRKLFADSTKTFIGHFIWYYDLPVLAQNNIHVPFMQTHDTLLMFHHYQPDLQGSLGFISSLYGMLSPWKHLMDSNMELYGCKDADAVVRVYHSLRSQMESIKEPSTHFSLWDGYEKFVKRLRPILAAMEQRGIPRSLERMNTLVDIITERQAQAEREFTELIPADLTGYVVSKTWPKVLRPQVAAYAQSLVEGQTTRTGTPKKPPVIKFDTEGIRERFNVAPYEWLPDGSLGLKRDFKPLSTTGLKTYLTFHGLNIPLNLKSTLSTSRADMDILRKKLLHISRARILSDIPIESRTDLFTTDITRDNLDERKITAGVVAKFLESVFAYRKFSKATSTYVTGKGWTPDSTGRIHTTFLLSGTASGQLSSRRPNVQNLSKGKDPTDLIGTFLGKELRRTLIAEPGHKIVELDYSGCHILTMGELAGSPDYVRLGRLDAHSFVAAHMVNTTLSSDPAKLELTPEKLEATREHLKDIDTWLTLSNPELAAKLGWIKSNFKGIRNDKAKPCIAEDQWVLTDKGSVLIQDITLDHKVFDGENFVTHEGLLYKGLQPVLNHDGLRATPDHIVYTEKGTTEYLLTCQRLRLSLTEINRSVYDDTYHIMGRTDHISGMRYNVDEWMQRQKYPIDSLAEVYDIANAGPNHRFVVNGKLVSNCVLGTQLGMGARKLYKLNDQSFSSQREAESVQETLARLFPQIARWQQSTRSLAHRQKYLISRHGFLRRFHDVLKTNSWGKSSNGPDAEKAGAFFVQNSAFGIIREKMIVMDEQGLCEKYQLVNTVHDSLVFHMPIELIAEGVPLLASIMESPSEYIKSPEFPNGLSLTVEASIGDDWASIQEVKIVEGQILNLEKYL